MRFYSMSLDELLTTVRMGNDGDAAKSAGTIIKRFDKLLASNGTFCVACCDECRHGNCRELCTKCLQAKTNKRAK